jgi:thymidylate synthase
MKQFHDLARKVLAYGRQYGVDEERTGTGTTGLFGEQLRFNLQDGFPLLTTKHIPFNLIKAELLWMLSGSTNNEDLRKLNGNDKPTIWEEWAYPGTGQLGPIYGKQWRNFCDTDMFFGVDQIFELQKGLLSNPFSRRHVVSAWNPQGLPDESVSPLENVKRDFMALAPCHMLFQMRVMKLTLAERIRHFNQSERESLDLFFVEGGSTESETHKKLTELGVPELGLCCRMDQRSADLFLGLPFNIAFYATLTHMFAHVCEMVPLELVIHLGDVHIYNNHRDQVNELLNREPFCLPKLKITNARTSVFEFEMDDLQVLDYKRHGLIKADVAI